MKLAFNGCGIFGVQILTFATAQAAFAVADDYAFNIVKGDLRQGTGVEIAVFLTDLRTNSPVTDAVIFATRLDMAPERMESMTTPVTASASDVPGQYQFTVDLTMAGNWRFQLAAKVQGEIETVQGQLILGVQP